MDVLLDALAMWALAQLLFIWFCFRLGAVRELEPRDYLEMQDYAAARRAQHAYAHATQLHRNLVAPPAGVCSSVAVSPCGPLEETPGAIPPRPHPVVRRGFSPESRRATAEGRASARPRRAMN